MDKSTNTQTAPAINSGMVQYPVTADNGHGSLPPVLPLSPDQALTEVGQTGTMLYNGYLVTDEYLTELVGRRGIQKYDEMRRSDATVAASLKLVKLPIMAADFSIESASDDAQDTQIAAEVEDQIFNKVNWNNFLRECMTFLDFGFSIFEMCFEYVDGKICLVKLGARKQVTLEKWQTSDDKAGITQVTPEGGSLSIPREKLLIFTWEQEGDNYEGMSLLRPAYKHWYFKSQLEKIQAMAMERQGLGIPMLTAPDNADEPSKSLARQALRNLRSNEQGYIEAPKGYVIDFMDMKGHTTIDPAPAIMYHDRQISKNVLGQFMELGGGGSGGSSGGSHALSTDQSRLFDQQLEAVAKKITEVINNDLIPKIVNFNYNGVTKYPKLSHGKIAEDDIAATSQAAADLADAGLLTPDPDLEQDLRSMLKVSDLPDEYRNDYNNRPRPQASTVPDVRDPASEDQSKTRQPQSPSNVAAIDDVKQFRHLLDMRIKAAESGS